ncbi:MAG: IS1 family transposase [Chitinophagaceae bacterium]
MHNFHCPRCALSHIKRNGHTSYGKQNYRCKNCGRQFVEHSQAVDSNKRELINRLLLERLSLRGICRCTGVSLPWLLGFLTPLYAGLPQDLNFRPIATRGPLPLQCLVLELDEMWSFVARKDNKQWVWIALETESRQVVAFYVGACSRESARHLWQRIPKSIRRRARFDTDAWEAYRGVLPKARHEVCAKGSGRTNLIERFNCTLRQRVSRLVRRSLSFSKKSENHLGAIQYFICHYNEWIRGRPSSALCF